MKEWKGDIAGDDDYMWGMSEPSSMEPTPTPADGSYNVLQMEILMRLDLGYPSSPTPKPAADCH